MRTPDTYDYHCSLLRGDLDKENSITYGIRCRSALNRINDFHVVDHLPQDIMHVLFEGVVPYELSLLLTDLLTFVDTSLLTNSMIGWVVFRTQMKKPEIHHLP